MLIARSLACVLATTIFAGQGTGSKPSAPELGDPFPCVPNVLLMVRSAQLSPSCQITRDGIQFDVAGDFSWMGQSVPRNARVSYVSVSDPLFRTEEGIHPRSSLDEVRGTGAAMPSKEPGWAFFTRLKSGWYAAFTNGAEATLEPLPTSSRVVWLFKRQGSAAEVSSSGSRTPAPACAFRENGFRSGVNPPRQTKRVEPDFSGLAAPPASQYFIVEVRIDATGQVTEACMRHGFSPEADRRVLNAVHAWRFEPPRLIASVDSPDGRWAAGTAVPIFMTLTVRP